MSDKKYDQAIDVFECIREAWEDALISSADADPHFLLKYHPGWVWTRMAWAATTAMAKVQKHIMEANTLRTLLNQRVFCPHKRGKWWSRLVLVTERYERMDADSVQSLCRFALQDDYVTGGMSYIMAV
jgi:Fanconi-associated nuclease 1